MSESENHDFNKDLVLFLSAVRNPARNATAGRGGGFTYKYAQLPDMLDDIRPIAAKHNFGVTFTSAIEDSGRVTVNAMLVHISGCKQESCASAIPVQPRGTAAASDPQSIGSCLTYLRRYTLEMLCGIAAQEDDDGSSASGKPVEQKPAAYTQKRREPMPDSGQAEGVIFNNADDGVPPPMSEIDEVKLEINELAKCISEKTGMAFADVISKHTTWADGKKCLDPAGVMRITHDKRGLNWLNRILDSMNKEWEATQ